ncbi:MAG: ABC transporter permease [cyanobacterium endosymbiont of Rhopalodia musculus]|uniref:ABC transporter permease n=1 Tax=cyanobacterium endosymbiont of Epithemia clementina EcSB TaxID=3034674 RepID=UPI00247FFD13|nr:ABC transporter permease [cyanobacterium endosymbiont of Epithemia clementina EcSB]WGT68194.1 ABC transporter permease [cyanobacterium endosymbiont of Epithemia clementina EcSB]
MISYLIKRLSTAIPTLLVISIVIFTILALAPGNPLGEFASNPAITPEIRENIRKSLGLDQPIYVRYIKWILAFIRGDLGYSFTSKSPVIDLILQRIPTTLWVAGIAYLLSFLIAFPLGIVSALKRYSLLDQIATTFTFLGFSLPTFLTGLLFIVIFSVQLKWFPFIYNSTLQITNWSSFVEQIKQSIMPVCVLALYQSAILMRFFRSAILDELPQEYVRTAYAKGLGSFAILNNHILRNAMIPVITLIALDIPTIFTGALVTEQVFRIPGIGALLIESIYRNDTPVVMAVTFIYAILIFISNFVADFTYSFLDPRVKLNQKK